MRVRACVCVYMCLVAWLCLTLCNPLDYSPPGSSLHGIVQARILEWVAISTPEDLSHPGIKPKSLMSPALADGFFITSTTWQVLRPQFLTW